MFKQVFKPSARVIIASSFKGFSVQPFAYNKVQRKVVNQRLTKHSFEGNTWYMINSTYAFWKKQIYKSHFPVTKHNLPVLPYVCTSNFSKRQDWIYHNCIEVSIEFVDMFFPKLYSEIF